jgi:DNA helicase II / ATP-dependent DNA helicase PcrA
VTNLSEKKLNKEQIEAIEHGTGPLLIIAGAGTGKTTVVTERIKYLIQKEFAKPSEILALTFTEKAAREMEERIDVALPYGYTNMWVSTFHSFCDRILRAEALNIGLDSRYKLMTEAQTVQFVRRHLFEFKLNYYRPLGNPTKFISGMMQHFSRLQDEDINPSEYMTWVNNKFQIPNDKLSEEEIKDSEKYKELSEAFKKYEEIKIKDSVMDYGDLIVKTLEVFRQRPNILSEYLKKFKYLLVDEFQDTNYSQNELVKLLAGKEKNITVVGDDDQAVYKFRGASVSNIVQFRKSFPETKVIVLTKNYRSNQEILDKSYDLIQFNNPDRLEVVENVNKKLISGIKISSKDKENQHVTFIHTDRVENEADKVAKEIKSLVVGQPDGQAYKWSDMAILVRANNHSDPFIRAFQRNGIPYQFLGPGKLFRQEEVIDLVSYLKVLYNIDDSSSFFRLLQNEHFEIDVKDLIRLSSYAKKYNYSLFEAAQKLSDANISDEGKEKISKLIEIINSQLLLIKKESAGQILYNFLQESELLQKLLNPDNPEAEKRAINISRLFDKLKTYESENEDASVMAVVDWIDLSSELGESPLSANEDWSKINAVNILTVHGAKGLEFPVVFLVNLVSQRFPSMDRHDQIPLPDEIIKEVLPTGDFHLQEERRLFYVGMTRAKNLLYLTASDYCGEGKREKKLSEFIFEALGDQVVASENPKTAKTEQLSFLDYSISESPTTDHQPLTTDLHIDYLSYSQIDAFQICPLHYKLRYILRVPTPPSASLSFGSSIHETLKDFYLAAKAGDKPSEKLILNIYEKDWRREGFTSKEHEKQFFEKGKLYLSGYLNDSFNAKNLPVLIEQKFTLPLPYKEGERQLKIGGVMDRVDDFGNSIKIVDYKTAATIPTQKDVDKNMQLTFYSLAASTIKEPPFAKDPQNIKLSLYFFDQQEELKTVRTQIQLNEAVDEIYRIRKEIENSDFKCSGHMFCQQGCEYSIFCNANK